MKSAAVICGPIGSGKTTAAAYVASEFKWKVVSFGGYLRDISEQVGVSSTREALQDLGDRLVRSRGASEFLRAVLEHAEIEDDDSVVFDGVRHPEMLMEIRKSAKATLAVFLNASREERYRRQNARLFSAHSLDAFDVVESHPVETGVNNLAELCELVIDGTLPLEEIQRSLRKTLLHLG